ncbi:hypothetical protein DAPPUDRAFT_244990 [Daphnia pulex]|uniref:Uncharacterized protein n=1 Tax=Daphnia pulex TaxID=6669 RepID=E9GMC3_DAPPU|nr:hypothetical protein DAPPUDRAFT_244990 [Daphnia pulex]|eukprot:EFX79414.1 hypothetical protein DAPPUDRAFT_244990 [Daphnia pulex]
MLLDALSTQFAQLSCDEPHHLSIEHQLNSPNTMCSSDHQDTELHVAASFCGRRRSRQSSHRKVVATTTTTGNWECGLAIRSDPPKTPANENSVAAQE